MQEARDEPKLFWFPAPGIIAAEIVANLEAALEHFSAIEEDLKE